MEAVWRWPEPLEHPSRELAPSEPEPERDPDFERDPEADAFALDVMFSAVRFPLPLATTAPLLS